MPYVSMFFGIIVRMFHNEHNPPHFHAEYQGQRAVFSMDGEMINGNIRSSTARRLIREWAELHRQDLLANWTAAAQGKPIAKIAPLD